MAILSTEKERTRNKSKKQMDMNVTEFEQIEKLKDYFRSQLLEELEQEIGDLKYADINTPRNGGTGIIGESEDHGYHHGLSQVQEILRNKL